ncbi:MAG: deoxyhypusine synthase family protein [Planctomycetes bacterium]|nr:deoxyhypusine synthase family protein [Planctomycetota bacterium]
MRSEGGFGTGWNHELKPLEPFDVTKARTFDEMLTQLSRTAFNGRNLGDAADVLCEMFNDPKCFVVGTFSGAMTIAKMGLLLTEMLDQGLLDAVVSTGALMCHGLVEQIGHTHFRYDPSWGDERLYKAGYARVYDTLELEKNLDDAEHIVTRALHDMSPGQPFGSYEFCRRLGERLNQEHAARGILQSAATRGIPVYVPAFTDSELGIDVYLFNLLAAQDGYAPIQFDPLRDVRDYLTRASNAERLGLFTVGGGVPRNWAQQVGPLAEAIYRRSGGRFGGLVRFRYAVRICPEPAHWGGLSGCTYSEGVSWGKFIPPEEGGRFAEVYADATLAWPILIRGVLERLGRV